VNERESVINEPLTDADKKRIAQILGDAKLFNPYHDEKGRFDIGGGGGKVEGSRPAVDTKVEGQHYSAEARAFAQQKLANARRVEPRITADMRATAAQMGGKLEGEQFRLKTEDSLTRKIGEDSRIKGISEREAADHIYDTVRYTMVFSDDKYGAGVRGALAALGGRGFSLENGSKDVKNFWHDTNTYRGINVKLSYMGQRLELQFHTPHSWLIKSGPMLALYHQFRLSGLGREARARIADRMHALSASIKIPPGALGIGSAIANG
jgi:hypothetical protein